MESAEEAVGTIQSVQDQTQNKQSSEDEVASILHKVTI